MRVSGLIGLLLVATSGVAGAASVAASVAAAPSAQQLQRLEPRLVVRTALPAGGLHHISGTISGIIGTQVAVQLRDGRGVLVEAGPAQRAQRVTALFPGRRVSVLGAYTSPGHFTAWAIGRARAAARSWPADH